MLNSRLCVGADGSGRSCLLLDQACIRLIYSVMVNGVTTEGEEHGLLSDTQGNLISLTQAVFS